MATIKARKQANGSVRHTAIVRIRRGKTVIHRESKTFAFRAAALSWAKHREVELEQPGALERAQQGELSLGSLVRWYIDSFCEISNWQRTKQTSLEFLEKHQIGAVNALHLTTAILIDHVRSPSRGWGLTGDSRQRSDMDWGGPSRGKKYQGAPGRPDGRRRSPDRVPGAETDWEIKKTRPAADAR